MKDKYLITQNQFENNNFANVVISDGLDNDFETIVALKPMDKLGITEDDENDERIAFYFEDWKDWCDVIKNGIDDMSIKNVMSLFINI